MHQLYLIGNGHVAVQFASFFKQYDIKFHWFKSNNHNRYFSTDDELNEPTIYLCAVNESKLIELLKQFSHKNENSYYGHLSGSLSRDIFPEMIKQNSFVLHPMQTFPNKTQNINLEESVFTFQGSEIIKPELESAFLQKIKMISLNMLKPEAYHLMGVFASNFLPPLMSVIQDLGKENGLTDEQSKELILPIMKQTLTNIENNSLINAQSGPLKRGANETVQKHEIFLKDFRLSYAELYQLFNEIMKTNILKK